VFTISPLPRIHAHVERSGRPEAESAHGIVELEGAHAEVEQHGIRSFAPAHFRKNRTQTGEITMSQDDPVSRRE